MTNLEAYMDHSAQIKGKLGKVTLDFDWDNPSTPRGAGVKDAAEAKRFASCNKTLTGNRSALFLRACQHATKNLASAIPGGATESLSSLSALGSVDLDTLSGEADIAPAAESVTGTLVPKN